MPIVQGFLQELEQEAQTTRRVLERVPDAHLDWRPHPKSYSLGQLALHVAQIRVPSRRWRCSRRPRRQVRPGAGRAGADLLPALRERRDGEIDAAPVSDAAMQETWRLVAGNRELMAMPRAAFAR